MYLPGYRCNNDVIISDVRLSNIKNNCKKTHWLQKQVSETVIVYYIVYTPAPGVTRGSTS